VHTPSSNQLKNLNSRSNPSLVEVVEASHPVPDARGLRAAERIRALMDGLGPDDLVLALISGGGSALLTLPANGLMLRDKQAVNATLLRSGASIGEMNIVRKHLSAIKGGRLAAAAAPPSFPHREIHPAIPRLEATLR
jgi:hydroxypyruvate reductase